MRISRLKTCLFCSTAALIVASAAYAQEDNVEVVVVTGQRAAINSAIQIKRDAPVIVDSISAEDVGKLPDNSVTEVLQRMAGVNITRIQTGGSSENYVGEGTGLQIRGLDSVVSQLNGRDSFSSANGRNLSWEDIPPELMQGVDIYKSLSASLPEGGFGGVINLRTRQPFDFDGLTFSGTLAGNYADYASKGRLGGSALISDNWHTKIGRIGILVNLAYSDLATKADGVQVSPFIPVVWSPNYNTSNGMPYVTSYGLDHDSPDPTACSGAAGFTCQEVYVPQAINYTERNDDRVRAGLYVATQWNPSDSLTLFATGFRSRYTENTLSYTISNTVSGYVALAADSNNTFDTNGNLISSVGGLTSFAYQDPSAAAYFGVNPGWDYQKIPYQFNSTLNHIVNQTTDFSVGGEWDPNDRLVFKFALQHVESSAANTQKGADLYAFVPGYGVTLSPYGSEATPVLAFPALDLTNKYRFGWNDTMDHLMANSGQENALYLDGSYTLSDSGFFRAVKFGVKVTDRTESDWESPWNWKALTPAYQSAWVVTNAGGTPLDSNGVSIFTSGNPVAQCFTITNTCQSKNVAYVDAVKTAGGSPAGFTTLVNTGTWFEGKAGLPAQVWFPSLDLLHQDFTTLHSYTDGLGAPGDQNTAIAFSPYDRSRLKETVETVYAQLNFAKEDWRVPFSGNIGVRVVAYKDSAAGAFTNFYTAGTSTFTLQPPAANYVNCDELLPAGSGQYPANCITHGGYQPNTISFRAPKTYVALAGSHSEVDVLPSFNITFSPTDELKIRFAASQGISRPTFSEMNPKGSISGSYVGTYQSYFNGSYGNPVLKPEKAEQFDASIEYYFSTGGLVHISPFYKQIHNYIASGTTQISTTLNTYVAGGVMGQGTMGCTVTTPASNMLGEACPQTVQVTMVQPLNEKQVATIRGFEAGLTKYADFLPEPFNSFGVDLNYTYISSSQPGALAYDAKGQLITGLPAIGLSKNTINAAIMYDRKPLSIKIAYNWRDSFLITTAAYQISNQYNYALNQPSAGGVPMGTVVHYSLPEYQYPSGTLDANLAYDLTDNIQWTIQASNLTKTVARLYMGAGNHRENRSWYTADTRYTSQLRVKF